MRVQLHDLRSQGKGLMVVADIFSHDLSGPLDEIPPAKWQPPGYEGTSEEAQQIVKLMAKLAGLEVEG